MPPSMNNSGHALTTNDIEAIRKAQHEWRLQKRRELEAKARKKQFRLSTAAAAQSPQKFVQSPAAPSLSNPSTITQPHPSAQPLYARQVSSGLPVIAGPLHNPALYGPTVSTPNTVAAASHQSVAQQILHQNAIQQQAQLQQMQQARQALSSQQAPMHPLLQASQEQAQAQVIASAALITTSPGVSIQPQVPIQQSSARPVAPRPSVTNDVNLKNAVAAAAAAADAASAAAVAIRNQFDGKAAAGKATEEEAAAAAAAAHAAANVTADSQYAMMLPPTTASAPAAKSTQEAVDVAAAAAAAAASVAIPGSSIHGASPLDDATRIKLEQLEAQRRWREEKRRELALKRAKGAGSKRGRKRTKFLNTASTPQAQVANQSTAAAIAAAGAGICTSNAPETNPPPGLGASSVPFSTSIGTPAGVPGTQPLAVPSGIQPQITAVQLGVQGGFLAGSQPAVSQIPAGSVSLPTASTAIVSEGHLTAEDAAAMYVQMTGAGTGTGTGTGGASLPMDTSGSNPLPISSSGGALMDVDVAQSGEAEVGDPGVTDIQMAGPSASATGTDAPVEASAEIGTPGDLGDNAIAKATETAAAEVAGESGNTGADTTRDASMVNVEHTAAAEEAGIETTGAEDGDGAAQQSAGDGIVSDIAHEVTGREGDEKVLQQEQAKDTADTSQIQLSANVEVSEVAAEDEGTKEKESGNDGSKEDQDGITESAERDTDGDGQAGETDANEDGQVGRDGVGETETKDDDDGQQDRFQEDGGEDIMTAAAWQSLDSINP